jgi:DNA-binding CsgD family transcriptional regulator
VLLDVFAGRVAPAAAHLREGLQIAVRTGGWFELNHYLDGCGYLCAATGRPAEALTMWAASAGLLGPADLRLRDLPLRTARQALGADRTHAAEDRGAAMNLAAAAEYALLLTASAPPQPQAPPGHGTLSAREQELVTLVAQGRTNAEIAAELFISARTVGSHLDRIRDKTSCRRRADLTRLALTTGLV